MTIQTFPLTRRSYSNPPPRPKYRICSPFRVCGDLTPAKVMDALEDSDEGEDGAEEEVEEACSGGGTQMEEPVASSQKEGEGTDGDFDEEDEVMETPLATASEGISREGGRPRSSLLCVRVE